LLLSSLECFSSEHGKDPKKKKAQDYAIDYYYASAFGHVGAIPFAWGPGAMQVRKGPARQRGSWASTVKLMQLFAR